MLASPQNVCNATHKKEHWAEALGPWDLVEGLESWWMGPVSLSEET